MARNRVLVQYPPEVIAGIDKIVGPGKRTAFLVGLAERELKLHKQREALREAAGCWKPEDHPELAEGAAAWVSKIRSESDQRFDRIIRQRDSE
jgi:hypothetical protein